jgi:hypothetical protein
MTWLRLRDNAGVESANESNAAAEKGVAQLKADICFEKDIKVEQEKKKHREELAKFAEEFDDWFFGKGDKGSKGEEGTS